MVRVKKFVLGPLATNTYIVYDNDAGDALVVDLGGFSEDLAAWIRSLGLEVRAIVATHGHIDHVYGVDLFKSVFDSVLVIHREDVETLENNGILCKALSLDCPSISPDKLIDREGVYRFGSVEVEVIHVPGHTPGSIAIYIPQLNMLLSGDTLFAGSVGRTDLPGGLRGKTPSKSV